MSFNIFFSCDSNSCIELNKIVAAVLLVALLVIGIGKISNVIFHVDKPETPGYTVEVDQASLTSVGSIKQVEEKTIWGQSRE